MFYPETPPVLEGSLPLGEDLVGCGEHLETGFIKLAIDKPSKEISSSPPSCEVECWLCELEEAHSEEHCLRRAVVGTVVWLPAPTWEEVEEEYRDSEGLYVPWDLTPGSDLEEEEEGWDHSMEEGPYDPEDLEGPCDPEDQEEDSTVLPPCDPEEQLN